MSGGLFQRGGAFSNVSPELVARLEIASQRCVKATAKFRDVFRVVDKFENFAVARETLSLRASPAFHFLENFGDPRGEKMPERAGPAGFFNISESLKSLDANDPNFAIRKVVPVMNQEGTKHFYLNRPSHAIQPGEFPRGRRMIAKKLARLENEQLSRSAAGQHKIRDRTVERIVPRFRHLRSLRSLPGNSAPELCARNVITRIHPGHGLIDFTPDMRIVDTIQNAKIFLQREPLFVAHGLKLFFHFSETHGGKMPAARPFAKPF